MKIRRSQMEILSMKSV